MGKDNKCKAVFNHGIAGKERVACSVCGAIWINGEPDNCPKCKRRVKPSKISNKI